VIRLQSSGCRDISCRLLGQRCPAAVWYAAVQFLMCTEVQIGLFVAMSTVLNGALSGKTLLTRALELAPRALLASDGPQGQAGMSAVSCQQ
jgi:hypothetical protein